MPNHSALATVLPEQWHIDRAPSEVVQLIGKSPKELGNGSFSYVFAINKNCVLKLTTCNASNIILPKLLGNPTPGLPLVFQSFGEVGYIEGVEDFYSDIPIYAYLMERLWSVDNLERVSMDCCPRGNSMRANSADHARNSYRWLQSAVSKASKQGRTLKSGHDRHPFVEALNNVLSRTRYRPLVTAVNRMSQRVSNKEWEFDWQDCNFKRNVMLSRWGEPILSDPVYSPNQPIWRKAYPCMSDYSYDTY